MSCAEFSAAAVNSGCSTRLHRLIVETAIQTVSGEESKHAA